MSTFTITSFNDSTLSRGKVVYSTVSTVKCTDGRRNLVISVFFWFRHTVSKYPKEDKMNKCIKGKQFWCEECIHDQGTCVACPQNLRSCYNEDIANQKRCVDSCRKAKPKPTKKAPTSIVPTTPTSSAFSPSGLFPTPSILVGYRSALHPGEAKKDEPRLAGNNGDHHINVGLIVAVSVLSVFAVLTCIVVSLVLLSRRNRERSRRNRNRDETEGGAEERIDLNVTYEIEENSPANDGGMDLQPNDEEQRFQANGVEEGQASQETQPAVYATPPCSIRVFGTQETEEDNCSSCLHLNEVHN
ncbi:Hypothetical predicted protein [Paramuricea clavata]|uniref:Uncharacterized protein n=1 Tax=Paramuricea clavata TaxID=317549 RepID=A0A7D9I5H0_PARCT|nr:Hypothetical predicted protein [Paramuricea clavata]